MTQAEREALARDIARELHGICPLGMTQDLVATLQEIAVAWRTGKQTFWKTFCWFTVVGITVMAITGVAVRFRSVLARLAKAFMNDGC